MNVILAWAIAIGSVAALFLLYRRAFGLSWWMIVVLAVGGLAIQHAR